VTLTKFHVWTLTHYERLVYLDADTLVLQNIDSLFEVQADFAAAPDVGWPDCFNSGVFVCRPSMDTYRRLLDKTAEVGSFDGGDQGILNDFFSDWSISPNARLPFVFNVVSTAFYSYRPAFMRYKPDIRIFHFIGENKPWLSRFDPPSSQNYEMKQLWWKYYDYFVTAGVIFLFFFLQIFFQMFF
jgi:glycogenin glucosyltransferase